MEPRVRRGFNCDSIIKYSFCLRLAFILHVPSCVLDKRSTTYIRFQFLLQRNLYEPATACENRGILT